MTFPQLTSSTRTATLLNKIISAQSASEATKLFASFRGGSVQRTRFEKKLKSRISEVCGDEKKLLEEIQKNDHHNHQGGGKLHNNLLSELFLKPKPPKIQSFIAASSPEKYRLNRLAKWNAVADNLARMDSQIIREYRERRAEFKSKSKRNNYPF